MRKSGRKSAPKAQGQRDQGTNPEENMSELNSAALAHDDEDTNEIAAAPAKQESSEKQPLQIKVSAALIRKLTLQAQDEGVSLEEFIGELLAESVVLRAWEIVERKAQMRGGNAGGNQVQNQNRNQNQGGGRHNHNKGNSGGGNRNNRNHQRYHALMDDKAAFLEYVRNQERKQR